MKLIATLPAYHRKPLIKHIMSHPLVDAVRYNTGIQTNIEPEEILGYLKELSDQFNKPVWVDLKGRQLRIEQWADPLLGEVVLSHSLNVDCPATIFLRGDESTKIVRVEGKTVYLDPPPRFALGAGQAVNVHGKNLKINGYLTIDDCKFLSAASKVGINNFMLSFVESMDDIHSVESVIAANPLFKIPANLALKIESNKGLDFVSMADSDLLAKYQLIAARDDLFVNIGSNKVKSLEAIKQLVIKDSKAVLASRIFSGLETGGSVSLSDYSDLRLMQLYGYQNFMLSDGICARYFTQAIQAWTEYLAEYGGQ